MHPLDTDEFRPAYLKWRRGRPRWEPGPRLRAAGFKGRDLRGGDGAWLGRDAAAAAAAELNCQVAAWRAGSPRRPISPRPPRAAVARSVAALGKAWQGSPKWARLAPSTQADYACKLAVLTSALGERPVAALTKGHLYAWWECLVAERGHAMANGILAVTRAALSHADRLGWISVNPARGLGIDGVPPRVVVWTPAEIAAAIELADAGDVPEVADAIVIALHTGQRQGDVLALEDEGTDGGRCRFRQSKTRARVSVPIGDQLAQRLAAIRARRGQRGVVELALARRLVLRPDGRPFDASSFGKLFRPIRAAVAARPGLAGFATKEFRDLRDTAITRLALAGCTVAEIRAISGHSLESVHQVLRHYLAQDEAMADTAIAKLQSWMQTEGIAV